MSAPSLEPPYIYIDSTVTRWRYVLRACRCRSWWCPTCSRVKAERLQQDLVPRLAQFRELRMIHLTVAPDLFGSPREAWKYLRTHRCVPKLMQDLRRKKLLHHHQYFGVLEIQPGTGFPHYHILLDSGFIPHADLLHLWAKHRPGEAGSPPPPPRPVFGAVWVSPHSHQGPVAAATDAIQYVTKADSGEVPDWVLGCRSVRRTFASRGFWPSRLAQQSTPRSGGTRSGRRRTARTSQEIVAACRQTLSLMRPVERVNRHTGETQQISLFAAEIRVTAALKEAMKSRFLAPHSLNIEAASPREAVRMLERQLGCPIEVIRWAHGAKTKEAA